VWQRVKVRKGLSTAEEQFKPGSDIALLLQDRLPAASPSPDASHAMEDIKTLHTSINSPVSSKFSRSMSPNVAQNRVCRDSKRLRSRMERKELL
jgi:hypothetical protein